MPSLSSFGPIKGLGIKLIWSFMSIMSPTLYAGLTAPDALVTINSSTPKALNTLIGNVTCCMLYPS